MSDFASDIRLPRVTIQFCTQCKWNLRAAYFAQELLQTFSTSLGEVSLQPSTGGVFKIDLTHSSSSSSTDPQQHATTTTTTTTTQRTPIWDRATDGGFPETKELKRRVRDVIEPDRNLGHVDRDYSRRHQPTTAAQEQTRPVAAAAAAAMAEEPTNQPPQQQQQQPATGGEPSVPLPRPRDLAAQAHTLTHPPDAPQPTQRAWGSRESDRRVPGGGGVGGTKPLVAPQPVLRRGAAQKDEEMKLLDDEAAAAAAEGKCEDCG